MSDTVEKIMCAVTCLSYPRATIENVVKKIEDQNDQLAKQCVKNVEEIGELRAALAISEKKELATRAVIDSWKQDEGADAARLEWLMANNRNHYTCRENIDEDMKEESNNEQ